MRAALEHVPAGVMLADAEGTLVYANPEVERALETPFRPSHDPRNYGGWTLCLPGTDEPFPAPRLPLARKLATGEPVFDEEIRLLRADGATRTVIVNTAAVRDEAGVVSLGVAVFIDVTERKRAEESLRELRDKSERECRQFEAMLAATEDFIYTLDVEGRFTYANRALLDLWQIGAADALGKTFRQLGYPPHLVEQHGREVDEVVSTGRALRSRSAYTSLGGIKGEYEYIFVPLTSEEGRVEAIVGVTRDTTERNRAEEDRTRLLSEAQDARERADEANRAKSEFLAVMSHELRTPLNAISGYVDLLDLGIHGPITDAQRGALQRIQLSQQHLLGLINDVLNYAKIEADSVHYETADVYIAELLQTVEGLVEPLVRARGLTLTLGECPPTLRARRCGQDAPDSAQPAWQRDQVHRAGRRRHAHVQAAAWAGGDHRR